MAVFPENNTLFEGKRMNVVLLYDVFHELENKDQILTELHKILCDNGVLSFSDHHLEEEEITNAVMQGGYFKLVKKGKKTCTFKKNHTSQGGNIPNIRMNDA
jgi:2-polyprenyl-3-methyl-5-hydroxy-6-metoxy-1,4-benzoquinol methylase